VKLPAKQDIKQRTGKVLERIELVKEGKESSLEDILKTHWKAFPLPGVSAGGQCQDASEFLYEILDDVKYAGPQTADTITCCDCKTYNEMRAQPTAILNIPMAHSVSAGLDKYQETQSLSIEEAKLGEVPIGQCKSCTVNKEYLRLTEVREAPKVLLLLVNRWDKHLKKDTSRVRINNSLNLNGRKYNLTGWVSHLGNRQSGHYYYVHREEKNIFLQYEDNKQARRTARTKHEEQKRVYLASYICEDAH
jgi:ubiquitin C-terminal hydrolase